MVEYYKIEKNIPLPKRPVGETYKFLSSLEVGDSALVPRRFKGTLYSYGRRLGMCLSYREIDKEHGRIWRTK